MTFRERWARYADHIEPARKACYWHSSNGSIRLKWSAREPRKAYIQRRTSARGRRWQTIQEVLFFNDPEPEELLRLAVSVCGERGAFRETWTDHNIFRLNKERRAYYGDE